MQVVLAVFIGGGLGSVGRYRVSKAVTSNFTNINPVGTFTANLLSTLLLGIILAFTSSRPDIPNVTRAMLIVGFCGGFSTFSTFSYETFELIRSGSYLFAAANIVVSTLLGIGVLFALARNI